MFFLAVAAKQLLKLHFDKHVSQAAALDNCLDD